jgi:uncharacterized protein (DUF2236 family)
MATMEQRQRAEGAPLGPGSLLWATASDPRCLLTGSAAGILQLMLPGLGAGVTDHSNFFDDPLDRIFRSVPAIWGSIFVTDGDEAERRGHAIRDFHPEIKGVDHRGDRYHALDPEIFWWAHATFTWEMFRARDLYFPVPLSPAQREQLYAETVTWYRRYGVSDRPVPPTLAAFEHRFDEVCRSELDLTPAAAWVLDPRSNPAATAERLRLPGPLQLVGDLATGASSELLRVLVYGAMPDVVRRRFGLRWTLQDRFAFVGACLALRSASPAVHFGALSVLWPEGTPHLAPGSRDRIVVAGPSPAQRRRRSAAA